MPRAMGLDWRRREAKDQGRLWTPADSSLVVGWLDASDQSSTSALSTTWVDKKNPGNNCTVYNAAPSLIRNGYNGKLDLVRFNGSSQGLFWPCSSWHGASPHTIFCAFIRRGTANDTYGTTFASIKTGQDYGVYHFVKSNNSGATYPYWYGGSNPSSDSTMAYVTGTPYVLRYETTGVAGGNEKIIRNFQTTEFTATLSVNVVPQDAIGIAVQELSILRYGQNDYLELITCNAILSDAEKFKLEGYLAHKWGVTDYLAADHLFRNKPPLRGM